MSDTSRSNHGDDPLDCSHLGPDDIQNLLQDLLQVLHSAQVGQIDELFQFIHAGPRLRRFDHVLGKSWEACAALGPRTTIAAEMKEVPDLAFYRGQTIVVCLAAAHIDVIALS
jgi:hypothetical protein